MSVSSAEESSHSLTTELRDAQGSHEGKDPEEHAVKSSGGKRMCSKMLAW